MEGANISKQLFQRAEEARDEHNLIVARLREEAGKSPVDYQQLAMLQSKMEKHFLALIAALEAYNSDRSSHDDREQFTIVIPSAS